MINTIFLLFVSIVLTSCSLHSHYPTNDIVLLSTAKDILILQKQNINKCVKTEEINGVSKTSSIEDGIRVAMIDARNKATKNESNVLIYDGVYVDKGLLNTYIKLKFDAYICLSIKIEDQATKTTIINLANLQNNNHKSDQKQRSNRLHNRVRKDATNQAAAMATQQAANAAAQQAAMAASAAASAAAASAAAASAASAQQMMMMTP